MKKLNFGFEQNVGVSTPESVVEKTGKEIKEELRLLSTRSSQYSPESEEFSEIKESFIKIQPIIQKEIQEYIKKEEASHTGFDMSYEYESYFELINKLNLLTESDKEMGSKLFMLSNGIDRTIARDILEKRQIYKSKENNENKQEYLADYILKKLDFSENEVADLIQSWLSVEDDDIAEWCIYESLKNMSALENFEKTSTKYLYNNFGIRSFGRYSVRELKKQYREIDEMGPYGLDFHAVMDWNGSFSESNQSEEIREKVEENDFTIRIIEANGKIDLAKRLRFLRDKYNQKIKFMYMHVHGNTDVIGLGDREGSDRNFLQKDLMGKGVQRIKDLFESNAELILSSCLTGVKGGLAEEIANTYGVKVIASDKSTVGVPKSVDIKKNLAGDNLEFNVVFNAEDEDDKNIDMTKRGTVIYNPKNR